MLQVKSITKTYKTADFEQKALDALSVTFRDNEFAAILGPSGSGKTTLLNIIGGLDRADSGEMLIDGVSTKLYKDRDWDTYRNNRIGFVFQNYNLISHQSVLANVELALTLSGVSKTERQRRAKQALDEVGILEHMNKKPSQLSGGQMQRVSIARALVNDPEILLADEPTGALDSKTSLQIMELLKKIAEDRLVIMVTHNPNLADTYATRTINLHDGQVVSDSDPFVPLKAAVSTKTIRQTAMSFATSLSLSFSNLMTKKGRTLMTAFAGSIGIIGIAAILALANGVNEYIRSIEESTLSQYPLSINRTGMDLASMMNGPHVDEDGERTITITTGGEGYVREINLLASMFKRVTTNDLASLKVFFDDEDNEIWQYVNSIEYSYDLTPQIYLGDTSDQVRQVNPGTISRLMDPTASSMGSTSSALSFGMSMTIFNPIPSNQALIEPHYNVLAGRWPEAYNECVLVTAGRNLTSDYVMYALGLRDTKLLDQMIEDFMNQKEVYIPVDDQVFSYEEIMNVDLRLVLSSDYYTYDEAFEIYIDHREDETYLRTLVQNSERLVIVGIVGSNPDSDLSPLRPGINYSPLLIDYLMEKAAESELVQAQLANPDIDIFTGKTFEQANSERSSDFDMSKLLTIDEDAISDAFAFDTSALGSLNLSGAMSMNPGSLDMSSMGSLDFPPLDLTALFAGVELTDLPIDGLIDFAMLVLSDYLDDRQDELQVIAQDVLADFAEYLQEPQAQYIIGQGLPLAIDYVQMNALISRVISEFLGYCIMNGIDADGMAAAFPVWLSDPANSSWVAAELNDAVDNEALLNLGVYLVGSYLANRGYTIETITDSIVADFSVWVSDPMVAGKVMYYFTITVDLQPLLSKISMGLAGYLQSAIESFLYQFMAALQGQITSGMSEVMSQLSGALAGAFSFDGDAFAGAFQFNMNQEDMTQLMLSMMGRQQKSYESNMKLLGYATPTEPSSISIYPKDFVSKQSVIDILENYNYRMENSGQKDKVIIYTDFVGALMGSVTKIVDNIRTVLVAFVAISLIVSSIMIGIVTYISVLERKKEIGILRSIGASKRDISNVFNAETLIIGFAAGVIGIGLTALACIPANLIVEATIGIHKIAQLPLVPALQLIVISCLLSFVAGLIPSVAASRRDPVEALRSE
ncbi:MAG: ABC transporter ATP-binding protein/permease [Coriobacteriia bacterium]|nr:ABC transporter ATP-binding protein/permease [Coriobacteriia bacterium]